MPLMVVASKSSDCVFFLDGHMIYSPTRRYQDGAFSNTEFSQCGRIIVLDKGHIVEDGSDEELISQSGTFADLAARQRLDDTVYVGKTTAF